MVTNEKVIKSINVMINEDLSPEMLAFMPNYVVGQVNVVTNYSSLGVDSAFFRVGRLLDEDGDGVSDAMEDLVLHTDWKVADSGGDGLLDGEEIAMWLNPNNPDTDEDGLSDIDELVRVEAAFVLCSYLMTFEQWH